MRGADQSQSAMFSYLSPETRVRREHPLRAIRMMVDRALGEMSALFDEMYSELGRPSIPPEKLLRAQLLQMLYSVRSERLLMEEIDYSVLFRWFVGLSLDAPIWSPTTFSKNRERLLASDVAAAFFDEVVGQARAAGRGADKPAEQNAVVDLLHQEPLAAHGVERLQQQRPEQLLGRNRWPSDVGVHPPEPRRQLAQHLVRHRPNRAQWVVGAHALLGREITEHVAGLLVGSTHATAPLKSVPAW